jgi:hypothetical protein
MSRVTNLPEQDVGGGDGDGLPTYENLAEAHGPNSRYVHHCGLGAKHGMFSASLVVQVWQVEKLGREEVTSLYCSYSPRHVSPLLRRAAERYADITPEERERRRQRGWGDSVVDNVRGIFLYLSF